MKKTMLFAAGVLFLVSPEVNAQEVRYTTHIKAVFDRSCAACHGSGAPEYGDFKKDKERFVSLSKGPKMDTYAHLIQFTAWPDTGALMRRLDDGAGAKDKKAGNMYQYLGSTEEERQKNLKLFKDWVGNWVLKRWPEMTKEDMTGITVKY